jgi:uncharacterized damage-inducible protein DinB
MCRRRKEPRMTYVPLDITAAWSMVNDDLGELLDLLSEEQLEWSPRPDLWNTRGILLHVVFGRYGLTGGIIEGGDPPPDILGEGQTRDGLRGLLRMSWQRIEPFLSDRDALDREYQGPFTRDVALSGHWLAFGLLEHDIHHRADIIHYLRELGIPHEEPDTLAKKLRDG